VVTGIGRMALKVRRDRQGSFDPLLIAKYQRRFPGFDDKNVSMYARATCWTPPASRCRPT
jgi:transposase-like protein